ncbi:MAG TPA: hypothetical protein DHV65_03100, partial [Ktedonobacter sp.]|nr:hypothetical protein [Ktedonobacter sp.]
VAFAEAVTLGAITVEEVTCRLATSFAAIQTVLAEGEVPVVVDPAGSMLKQLRPTVLVEATLSKYNSGIMIEDAPVIIALGPGYEAGKDVHAVI